MCFVILMNLQYCFTKFIMFLNANFTFFRFTDEVHFKGGALIASQMLSWAAVMFTWNARAPNPAHFGKKKLMCSQFFKVLKESFHLILLNIDRNRHMIEKLKF